MSVRRFIRESAFNLARRDIAMFLEEHEEDILAVFREEMQRLDDEIPEEDFFIDLNMVGIGDMVVKAALRAFRRFLGETEIEVVGDAVVAKKQKGATIPVSGK